MDKCHGGVAWPVKNSCSQAEWSFLKGDAHQKEVSIDDLPMCEADGSPPLHT